MVEESPVADKGAARSHVGEMFDEMARR